jgi:hypothetical protein
MSAGRRGEQKGEPAEVFRPPQPSHGGRTVPPGFPRGLGAQIKRAPWASLPDSRGCPYNLFAGAAFCGRANGQILPLLIHLYSLPRVRIAGMPGESPEESLQLIISKAFALSPIWCSECHEL